MCIHEEEHYIKRFGNDNKEQINLKLIKMMGRHRMR